MVAVCVVASSAIICVPWARRKMSALKQLVTRIIFIDSCVASRIELSDSGATSPVDMVSDSVIRDLLDSMERAICKDRKGVGSVSIFQGSEGAIAQALESSIATSAAPAVPLVATIMPVAAVPAGATPASESVKDENVKDEDDDKAEAVSNAFRAEMSSPEDMDVDLYCHEALDDFDVPLAHATLSTLLACPEDDDNYTSPDNALVDVLAADGLYAMLQ